MYRRRATARCDPGPGAALRTVRGRIQADAQPGDPHRQAAADVSRAREREAEDRPAAVLGAAEISGERVAPPATGESQAIRARHADVLWHCRLQSILRCQHERRGRHEDCGNAEFNLYDF